MKTCDVRIKSNGKTIYGHKNILAANSPYFQCPIYGEFSEGKHVFSLFELDMSQFDQELIESAIDSMYSDDLRFLYEPLSLIKFLCLANFLQYASPEEKITNFKFNDWISPKTCLSYLIKSC